MKTNGSDASKKLNAVAKTDNKSMTLKDWLRNHQNSLEVAIPKGTLDIDRFMQSALLAIYDTKSPNLARCTPESIFRSLKESASLGLEVGGVLGQAYLIPYNEKGVMTAHFQMG